MTKYDDKFKNDLLEALSNLNDSMRIIASYFDSMRKIEEQKERERKIAQDVKIKMLVDKYAPKKTDD